MRRVRRTMRMRTAMASASQLQMPCTRTFSMTLITSTMTVVKTTLATEMKTRTTRTGKSPDNSSMTTTAMRKISKVKISGCGPPVMLTLFLSLLGLSKYERKLHTIRKTINKLEEENLQKRSWQLMGEVCFFE